MAEVIEAGQKRGEIARPDDNQYGAKVEVVQQSDVLTRPTGSWACNAAASSTSRPSPSRRPSSSTRSWPRPPTTGWARSGPASWRATSGAFALASAVPFHDRQAPIVVVGVDQARLVDEHVAGLDHPRPAGAMVDHARRGRGYQRTDLHRLILVADVVDADAGVLHGREDEVLALEPLRPVLIDVVWTAMGTLGGIVGVRGYREGRDADRVGRDAVVEQPDQLQPVLQIVEHRLVQYTQQLALGQGQAVVGAAAEGRAPVAVDDRLGRSTVGHVQHDHAGVAPGAVGGIAVHDRMVQAIAALGRPGRGFAGSLVHAGDPPAPC